MEDRSVVMAASRAGPGGSFVAQSTAAASSLANGLVARMSSTPVFMVRGVPDRDAGEGRVDADFG